MPWSRPFDFPVQGFRTLRDAADHIVSLPKAEQAKPHWQIAAFVLTEAAEGRGPMLHASIGMNKALNFGKPEPDRVPRHKQAKKYKIIR